MINIIKADLYKIAKTRLFKMLFLCSLIAAFSMVFISKSIASGNDNILESGLASFFSDNQIFTLLGSIVIGIIFANDFEYKIIEQTIIAGYKKSTIVISKMIVFVCSISILTIPYIMMILIAVVLHLDLTMYMPSPFLSVIPFIDTSSIAFIILIIILAVLTYSAQLSIGILIMFLLKKPAIVMATTYICLVMLGPVLSLNETTKTIMSYTPFGIDYTNLIIDINLSTYLPYIFNCICFLLFITFCTYLSFKKIKKAS